MRKWFLLFFVFYCASLSFSQKIDTSGNTIVISTQINHEPTFIINWHQIKLGRANVRVDEKLGSYDVSFRSVPSIDSYNIVKKTDHLLLLKSGEKEIQLTLNSNKDGSFVLIVSNNQSFDHWEIPFYRIQNEKVYGGGIQFSEYHEYNKKMVNLTQENGIGRGGGSISKWTKLGNVMGESFATYCPSAYIFTSQNRCFSWNDYAYSEVDCTPETIVFTILDESVTFQLGFGNAENPLKMDMNPKNYELPDWSLGTILGLQGGTDQVLDKVSKVVESGALIDAVWIQDWVGKRPTKYGSRLNWAWELDTLHYSHFENFKTELQAKNIKLLGYINPFFAEHGKYITEGLEKGYFIYYSGTDTPRLFKYGGMQGYMLDIFNDEAYQWMKYIIKTNLIDNGFSGWMADFAEWYPIREDPKFILTDLKLHNEYPILWSKLNYEVIQESGQELFFFNRSGGKGTAQYSSMMWAGDQMVDYSEEDGLLSVFDAYLSSAHSGLPLIHSDAGGYTSVKKPFIKNYIRDTSLLKDWLFLEACTPVLRTHEGLLPDENAQVYDDHMLPFFSNVTRLHAKLLPYFRSIVIGQKENNTPYFKAASITNNAFIHHPEAIAVGDDLVILFVSDKRHSIAAGGWLFLSPNGTLSEYPVTNMKIQILINPKSEILELLNS